MSLRRVINEKCKDCIYDPASKGTWRQQVSLCCIRSCPLWSFRPKPTRPIPLTVISNYTTKIDQSWPKGDV
jgi:hypothetical protein